MQKEILLFKKEIENPNTNINPKTKTILTVSYDITWNNYNNYNHFAVIELLQCNSVSNSIDIMQTSRVKLPDELLSVTFDPNTNITSTNNNILLAVGCYDSYFTLFNVEIIYYQQF